MSRIELPANGWKPAPHQMKAWRALNGLKPVSTAVLAWHRRAGKDEIALHNAAIKCMQRVGTVWHLLPEQEQARKAIWEGVNPRTGRVRWKDAFPDEIIEHVDNQGMKLTLKNNSTWQVLGSDNYNSLVGTSPVGMTFSEAALANPAAFSFFRPILAENNGWSMHISSVRGRNHFYNLFKAYEDQPDAFVERLSAADTTVFTPETLEIERKLMISLNGAAIGKALFEQEYMSSWDAAIIGAVWGEELKELKEDGRMAPFRFDPRYPVDTSWDIGVLDPTIILFWQTIGNVERLIDWYSSTDTGIEHYAEVLAKKPYYYHKHIGPHDSKVREWGANGVSRLAIAQQLGIKFERMPNIDKTDSIAAGSRMIKMMEINVSDTLVEDPMDDCAFVLNAIEQFRFTFDREKKVMSKNPVHDWTSHYADALMTRAIYVAMRSGNHVGRPILQGNTEVKEFDTRRLRDIMRTKNTSKGAWG